MANLNMESQKGNLLHATEVPTTKLGQIVARPTETAKVQDGTFGNFRSDLAAANIDMEQAKQIAPLVNDSILRAQNLQIAEEDAKKSVYHLDWQTAEREARQAAKEIAADQQLDTDAEHEVYKDELANRTSQVDQKYTFYTRVGNDIAARRDAWMRNAQSDYIKDVVEPRRVEKVKATTFQVLAGWNKALSDGLAQESDASKVAQALMENKAAVQTYLRQPQMIAVFGADQVEKMAAKTVNDMFLDAISLMTNQNPEGMIKLLRNATGDSRTDVFFELDPSMRRQVLYQAEKELSIRRAEAKAELKERQDKNEVQLTFDIVSGKLSGNAGISKVLKMYQDGEIDQSHVERAMTKFQIQADRAERRAEAAAARSERARERENAILQPIRDSLETGLPLDPNNAQHVKSVNVYAAAVMAKDPKNAEGNVKQIIAKTGVVPTAVHSQVYGLVNSKDPKEVKAGVSLFNTIVSLAPNATKAFNETTLTKVHQINAGVSPEQAQLNADQARRYTPEQKAEMRKPITTNATKIDKTLAEVFGVKAKNIPTEVKGAMKELLHEHIILSGGDFDIALISASAALKNSYGLSTLSGKPQIMYNPPEGRGGETTWMNEQYKKDLDGIGLKPEQVRLTANAQGSWDLIAVNENGVPVGYVTSKETGKKLVWTPDYDANIKEQKARDEAETKRRNEEVLKAAEKDRKAFIEQQRIEAYKKAHPAPTAQEIYKDVPKFRATSLSKE